MDINDIKEQIEEVVEKIKADPKLLSSFKDEPVKTVEKLIGLDLPDDLIDKVVDAVKAKIDLDKLGDIGNMLKKLF